MQVAWKAFKKFNETFGYSLDPTKLTREEIEIVARFAEARGRHDIALEIRREALRHRHQGNGSAHG